jgi:hypothetical protein
MDEKVKDEKLDNVKSDKIDDREIQEDETVVEEQKKSSANFLIKIVAVIFVIIFLIVFARNIYDSTMKNNQEKLPDYNIENYDYNGFNCTSYGNTTNCVLYVLESKQPYDFEFRYRPDTLETIPVYGDVSKLVNKSNIKFIRIAFPGNLTSTFGYAKTTVATVQLARVLGNQFAYRIPTGSGIIKGTDDLSMSSENTPLVDCSDASNGTAIVMFEFGNENKIEQIDDCYRLVADESFEDNIMMVADRFVYKLFGISMN